MKVIGITSKWLIFLIMTTITFSPSILMPTSSYLVETEAREDIQLTKKLNAILGDDRLNGAIAGVSIRKADTADLVYSHFGDILLRPASNMKILTTAAALETLGPDYQFSTTVFTDGRLEGKRLDGNVYVQGKGDPTLLKEDFDQFANDLKTQGIDKISGNLIGDDYWYDDVRLSQDLNWSDEHNYTGAQISALTVSPTKDYDAGTIVVRVTPSTGSNKKPDIKLIPETDYVTINNEAEMVTKYETKEISIDREHGTNEIIIEGTLPVEGLPTESWVSVWEPTTYALAIFKQSLSEHGISIAGSSQVGRTPKHATILTSKQSMPLKDLIIPFMKLSNNGIGETLTKEMGQVVHQEGSWDKGLSVTEDVITDLGVNKESIVLRDGSGMSHKNMIPADEISKLLYYTKDKGWFSAFEKSLPIAGEKDRLVGGTLGHRMTSESMKGNVKAKTGLLTGVATLSGYVTAKDGEKLIFSIMINNYRTGPMDSLIDAMVLILAEHSFD